MRIALWRVKVKEDLRSLPTSSRPVPGALLKPCLPVSRLTGVKTHKNLGYVPSRAILHQNPFFLIYNERIKHPVQIPPTPRS